VNVVAVALGVVVLNKQLRPLGTVAEMADQAQWIATWAASPQAAGPDDLPPAAPHRDGLVFAGSTLRQTVHATLGGQRIRLRLSNACGGTGLPVTGVCLALPRDGRAGVSAIRAGTSRQVTFGGQPGIDLPPGAEAVCDPLDFGLAPGSNLTVTMYLARGQAPGGVTSHPGSRTTSYLAAGNRLAGEDLAAAVLTDHWYFLGGLEVQAGPGAAAVVIVGDSLTDGRGSTTNANDRWPDRLFARLQSDPATSRVAVLNQGIGGNRVLSDGLGPGALTRLDRVLAQNGVRWLVVFEGVNDLGTAEPTQTAQQNAARDLISAYRLMIARARALRVLVFGATLTPFGGHVTYDDSRGRREAARQAVNQWIRSGNEFDAVFDFDRAVRDPAGPRRLLAPYDSGDHLHLSPAGYQALADAVPARLFSALADAAGQ
jgi:lysophospholipase L1-like esterase